MAATTTLKLPEELKARIASAAQASGKSPHAFMIEALEAQARLAEMRQSFIDDAIASAAEVDAGGALYAMEDVQAYILARTAGKAAKRPKPRDRNSSRLASESSHATYIETPDSEKTEGQLAKTYAKEHPILFLLRQNGSEDKDWRGTPFYWPIIHAQARTPTAIYTAETIK